MTYFRVLWVLTGTLALAIAWPFVANSAEPKLLSASQQGIAANARSGVGADSSARIAASDDGRFIVFVSEASNLVPGASDGLAHVFVVDLLDGSARVMDAAADGTVANAAAYSSVDISGNGAFVAFESCATNLVPADANVSCDVFVKELATGAIELANLGPMGVQANAGSEAVTGRAYVSLSDDGRLVLFQSLATNLTAGESGTIPDCYVRDRQAGTSERVNVTDTGTPATGACRRPAMTSDGRYIVWQDSASNLPACPRKDRQTGAVVAVPVPVGATLCQRASLSDDGNLVAFDAPVGMPAISRVFVADIAAGTSTAVDNGPGALAYGMSSDGRLVFLNASDPQGVEPLSPDMISQMYLRDRISGSYLRVSELGYGAAVTMQSLQGTISGDGTVLAFYATTDGWGVPGPVVPHAYVETEASDTIFSIEPEVGGFE